MSPCSSLFAKLVSVRFVEEETIFIEPSWNIESGNLNNSTNAFFPDNNVNDVFEFNNNEEEDEAGSSTFPPLLNLNNV